MFEARIWWQNNRTSGQSITFSAWVCVCECKEWLRYDIRDSWMGTSVLIIIEFTMHWNWGWGKTSNDWLCIHGIYHSSISCSWVFLIFFFFLSESFVYTHNLIIKRPIKMKNIQSSSASNYDISMWNMIWYCLVSKKDVNI